MKSSTLRAALVLLVTFGAGVAAGVAAERLWLDAPSPEASAAAGHDAGEKDEHGHREDHPRTTIERFADELGLTQKQRARIEEILSRHREEMHEMWSQIRPRFRRLMDSARADIESVLTEEQTEQYRRYLKREHGDEEKWEEEPREGKPEGATPDTSEGG